MIGRKEKGIFDKLCELNSPESNSSAYRTKLSSAKTPCIPYFGIYYRETGKIMNGFFRIIPRRFDFFTRSPKKRKEYITNSIG